MAAEVDARTNQDATAAFSRHCLYSSSGYGDVSLMLEKGLFVTGQWDTFVQLLQNLGTLLGGLVVWLWSYALLIAWFAWWLWGVNWRRSWAVLAAGAWLPLLLLAIVGALVWSQIEPSSCSCLGFLTIPNFWWQLGAVGLLGAATLFCGWLQGVLGWAPAEVSFDPPVAMAHDHGSSHH